VYAYGHGGGSIVADMKIKQLAIADIGNHVAIGHNKSSFGSWIE
jgi:hypothetical protein